MGKIILLMGPTAAGKTELALELAKYLPLEIISVDSAMVYRGMDIGTGKPTSEELARVPHHLIDIRDPSQPYSAAEFRQDALKLIKDIKNRGRIPLLVGGTMLYFRTLQTGLSPLPSADSTIREKLSEEAEKLGWQAMHKRLESVDPEAANRIHPNDPQRIQRALEVYEITGQPMSKIFELPLELTASEQNVKYLDLTPFSFALIPRERAVLHERIAKRFYGMLEQGLVEEVKRLYDRQDLNPNLPAMRCVGYRQVWQYLEKKITYDEMVEKAIAATRQLAKRQLTWLRGLPSNDIYWLEIENGRSACLKSMIHSLS